MQITIWTKRFNCKSPPCDTGTIEEVCVPVSIEINPLKESELIDISNDSPDFAFGIKKLNSMQSQRYKQALETTNSFVVCPDNAGTTSVALITILREIDMITKGGMLEKADKCKMIDVAPMKAKEVTFNADDILQEIKQDNVVIELILKIFNIHYEILVNWHKYYRWWFTFEGELERFERAVIQVKAQDFDSFDTTRDTTYTWLASYVKRQKEKK